MRLITRAEWRARAARSRTRISPTFGTTVHYEGPRMGSFPHESCPAKVRGIQAFHMDARGWADVAYTAVVCPHGYTFEGRWAGVRTAANGTDAGNAAAYAVCLLIGEGDPLTAEALAELIDVIDFLDQHAAAGPGVNGHRDWKATACPGEPTYRALPNVRAELARRRAPASHPATPALEEDDMPRRTPPQVVIGHTGPWPGGRWTTISVSRDGRVSIDDDVSALDGKSDFHFGDLAGKPLAAPIDGLTQLATNGRMTGYVLHGEDGGDFNFGTGRPVPVA